ncbi:MAG: pyridoxamine 5'-phosphate oxidase family protein [Thomasclavelia ramosa]
MKVNDYLNELRKIKDVAMATVDSDGYPQIRIIDVMAVENNNLYFLTARGKNFYQELLDKNFVSLVALTKDYASIV